MNLFDSQISKVGNLIFVWIEFFFILKSFSRLSKSKLTKYSSTGEKPDDAKVVQVENWTKWRLYVRSDGSDNPGETTEVIYGSSEKPIFVKSKVISYQLNLIRMNPEANFENPSRLWSTWNGDQIIRLSSNSTRTSKLESTFPWWASVAGASTTTSLSTSRTATSSSSRGMMHQPPESAIRTR